MENECTLHISIVLAICVPKIVTSWYKFDKVMTKTVLTVFFETQCSLCGSLLCKPCCLSYLLSCVISSIGSYIFIVYVVNVRRFLLRHLLQVCNIMQAGIVREVHMVARKNFLDDSCMYSHGFVIIYLSFID